MKTPVLIRHFTYVYPENLSDIQIIIGIKAKASQHQL